MGLGLRGCEGEAFRRWGEDGDRKGTSKIERMGSGWLLFLIKPFDSILTKTCSFFSLFIYEMH